jgi:hypothetical protein
MAFYYFSWAFKFNLVIVQGILSLIIHVFCAVKVQPVFY